MFLTTAAGPWCLAAVLFCCALSPRLSSAADRPTFHTDIVPILEAHCTTCHRPGQIGPFSLVTYADVMPRARQLLRAVTSGSMPPWLPERGVIRFANERRLLPEQIDTLSRWVAAGAPEGSGGGRASQVEPGEWRLGRPDLVVAVPVPFSLEPGERDVFRNFAVPIALSEGRWVRGIEVDPGDARVVHHASISIDRTRASRRLDEADAAPGFAGGMFAETAVSPDSRALGWTPGMSPLLEPEGMAWRLPKDADLVIQLHMIPSSDGPTPVRPRVALYFATVAPTRLSVDIRLGSRDIDIPAGESSFAIADTFTLPSDVRLMSVYPHAHYLAKAMLVDATLPDGRTRLLLSVRDWDFHWQEEYRYAQPVDLPRGTVVRMRYVYDNSAANRHRPPGAGQRRVAYGPLSSDEMGDLWLRINPLSQSDAAVLAAAYLEHERQKALALNERLVAAHPESAAWHNALGASYLEAGRTDEAVAQLREAIRLAPGLGEAHNNLAQAWRRTGRPREAVAEATLAVQYASASDVAQLNLGNALLDNGDLAEAVGAFERALILNPSLAEAHNNIGIALGAQGRFDEAAARFREALDLQPGYPDAARNLSVIDQRR